MDLVYCIDCGCYHAQISRTVTLKETGKKLGEICSDCNKIRIRNLIKKQNELRRKKYSLQVEAKSI